jgi:hypothetical protein
LLTGAETAPDVENRYGYGTSYVMAKNAPQALKETATTNELLLFRGNGGLSGCCYLWDI